MLAWFLGILGLSGAGIGIAALLGGGPMMLALSTTVIRAVGAWPSKRSLGEIVAIVVGLALVVDHIALLASHRHSAKVEAQISKCTAARHADQQSYTKAQADAKAQNDATVARDKAQRERITNDISQSYEAELGRLRADLAKRLLAQPAAPKGAPGQPGLPGVSQAPGGPDGGSRVSIPSKLYVRGAELELQLERLQGWVNEQLKIDPNTGAAAPTR